MIKDTLEVDNDGYLIASCEFQSIDITTFYSMEINGVIETNKELYFYE